MEDINSGDESDNDLISTEMLEDIRDGVRPIQTLQVHLHFDIQLVKSDC